MGVSKTCSFLLAASLQEALEAKAEYGERARFVSGGTDLLLQVRAGRHSPELLIGLPPTTEPVTLQRDRLCIPARTPLRHFERDPLLIAHASIVAEAFSQIGSPLIRNVATLGGNLGNASPAADSVPPLLVYNADLELQSIRGCRLMPVDEFFVGPGRTEVAPDEAITAVYLSIDPAGDALLFRKFGPRGANVISSASCAAWLRFDGSSIVEARLAAGSVAPRPIRLPKTEAALKGQSVSALPIPDLLAVARQDVRPISDVRGSDWYKEEVVVRAVHHLLDTLGTGGDQ